MGIGSIGSNFEAKLRLPAGILGVVRRADRQKNFRGLKMMVRDTEGSKPI